MTSVRTQQVEPMVRFLRDLRWWARLLLVLRVCALFAAVAVAALVVGGVLDFLVRSPSAVRVVGLMVACGAAVWALVRYVWPAIVFRPSLAEMALRVERQPVGQGGEMRGLLASAVELTSSPDSDAEAADLRAAAVQKAVAAWRGPRLRAILRPGKAVRAGILALVMIGAGLAIAAENPPMAKTGLRRVLTPWSAVDWPKRQVAVDVTNVQIQPVDESLPIRAVVVKTNRGLGKTPVRLWYRGGNKDHTGQWRSALLTGQERQIDVQHRGLARGEVYERLIDPAEVLAKVDSPDSGWIDYWFQTEDDQTKSSRIQLVSPPEVVGATASVHPPAYAATVASRDELVNGDAIDLGAGDDEHALVARVLAGSSATLDIRLNKSIPPPSGAVPWLSELDAVARDVNVDFDSNRIHISAVLDKSLRLPVAVEDEYGFANRDEAVYVFNVVQDMPPEPVVSEPDHDEQLIATAVVTIAGEARDDLGITELSLNRQIARPPSESEGAPAEGDGAWVAVAAVSPESTAESEVRAELDLATLGVRAGDEVWLTAAATDTYAAAGLGREPVRSAVRKLRIISESDLVEQIQAELGALRQAAMRLDEQQASLREKLGEQGPTRALSEQQRELTDRIAAQRGTIARLQQRQERNGLNDQGLTGMLRDADSAISAAAEASSGASRALAEAAQNNQRESPEADSQQQQVRDELALLISELDRGEDGWVARRSIERLLEEQREIAEQTQAAGQRMLGRKENELTPQERTELDRIADRQRNAARRAAEAIDQLAERARQMKDADPAQAAAMAEAAQQGRQQQVAEQLDQAAQDIQKNRTSNAQQGQQQAAEALQQMLEHLDDMDKQRNAALLRQLQSLLESIETLVRAQEGEIDRLAQARAGTEAGELDAPMIQLRNNTLAASVEAAQPDLAPVRSQLEQAADAQGQAVAALRAAPRDDEQADRREQESLLRLRDARAEAEKLEQQAQQAQQEQIRRKLRQAYREQLEQQVVLRDQTQPLVSGRLSRKDRATARGLGQRQDTVRTALSDLLKSTEGLREAAVFEFAHKRLDDLMQRAAETLSVGEVKPNTIRNQDEAITVLRMLVEVLAEAQQNQSDFDSGASGSQGGSGSGAQQGDRPLLPPIAELKLLRAMQADVASRTRALDESNEQDEAELSDLARIQSDLAGQAEGLIQRMKQQQGGSQAPMQNPGWRARQ